MASAHARAEDLAQTKVNPDTRVKDLSEADVAAIREFISKNFKVEGDLRREVQMSIKRLIEIGSYRGLRHRRNLPCVDSAPELMRRRKGTKKTVAGRGRRKGATKKYSVRKVYKKNGSECSFHPPPIGRQKREAHPVFRTGAYLCLFNNTM